MDQTRATVRYQVYARSSGKSLHCRCVLYLIAALCCPRYSHIPLTLFYSSLTKLFLLFLLTIWRPVAQTTPSATRPLAPQYNASHIFTNPIILGAMEILDEDKLDREWVVRNVLGGMAAGFGLRGTHKGEILK